MKPKIKTTCTKLQLHLLSFCLLCLSGKTRCDGNGPAVVKVEQDSDAVLPCSLSSTENIESYRFEWKKAAQIDGRQKEVFFYDAGITYDSGRSGQSEEFKGRVSHFQDELKQGNASIIIRNTKMADSGDYTCDFPRLQPPQTFHIKLVVEPVVVTVEQDRDALLPCSLSTKENIEQGHFDWNKLAQNNEKQKEVFQYLNGRHSNTGYGSQDDGFKRRVSHFQEELKHGNASIIIRNTKVADGGDYTCTFTEPRKTFHIKLIVDGVLKDRFNENKGATSKPNIRTLDQTDNRALLQCEVHGNPQPEVEWRDSAGNKLSAEEPQVTERHGRFYVTLNTTVTKTDRYRCVATEKNINHQIHDETFVRISEPVVVTVTQDRDALLPCSLSTKENIEQGHFDWNKVAQNNEKQKEVFQYLNGRHSNTGYGSQDKEFKDRVSHFQEELKHGNASIIIRNTKMADSGEYTCTFTEPRQTFHIKLVVDRVLKDRSNESIPGAAPKPNIEHLDQTDNRALLQCEANGNPQPEVEWRDSAGNTLPAEEPQVTERDGCFYVTLNTAVNKTDRYRCVATQKNISHQIYAETFVRLNDRVLKDRSDENIRGAAKKPSITALEQTKDWSRLQCEVQDASPKPTVEWKDSSGNKLPAEEPQVTDKGGGSYDIILQTTVTKTDHYHCVVTQGDINHQTEATIHVYISESTGWTVSGVLGGLLFFVIVGGVVLAVLIYMGCIPLNCKKGSPADHKEGSVVPLKSQPSRSQEAPDPET